MALWNYLLVFFKPRKSPHRWPSFAFDSGTVAENAGMNWYVPQAAHFRRDLDAVIVVNMVKHAKRRGSHCRRRDCGLQYRLASHHGWLRECPGHRTREFPGQGFHREKDGRRARTILDSREHPDVLVFNSLLRAI